MLIPSRFNFSLVVALCMILILSSQKPTLQIGCAQETGNSNQPIDLSHWKLTLPTNSEGELDGRPVEILPKKLAAGHKDSYFQVNERGQLKFWCPVSGARTDSAKYARCELREMMDVERVDLNWSTTGTHALTGRCRVMQVPSNPKVVFAQIHGFGKKVNPLVKLQFFKGRVEALVKSSPRNGKDIKLTYPDIELKSEISWQIQLREGVLDVTVNELTKSQNIVQTDPEWGNQTFYFKAGVYPQDNQGPDSEGARAIFSELSILHE